MYLTVQSNKQPVGILGNFLKFNLSREMCEGSVWGGFFGGMYGWLSFGWVNMHRVIFVEEIFVRLIFQGRFSGECV